MSKKALQSSGGALLQQTLDNAGSNFAELYSRIAGTGNVFYCDAVNGSDTTGDGSSEKPFASLLNAYNACVSGHNDVVVLVGDGGTTATQRQTAAFTWAKNATHLVGDCSPSLYSQRARIAPGTAATAYTPLMTISGSGCNFENIQFWHGFATGTTAQICLSITGSRNVFKGCQIAGMGDAASAADAGSRSIKLATGGENLFKDCSIGIDTVTRSAANASVEFASGTARNVFKDCVFPFMTSAATPLGFIGSGAACHDRHQIFENCHFLNAAGSGSTTISGLGTLAAASGGVLVFKQCMLVGITEYGTDATTRGVCYVDNAYAAATSGIGINPT